MLNRLKQFATLILISALLILGGSASTALAMNAPTYSITSLSVYESSSRTIGVERRFVQG